MSLRHLIVAFCLLFAAQYLFMPDKVFSRDRGQGEKKDGKDDYNREENRARDRNYYLTEIEKFRQTLIENSSNLVFTGPELLGRPTDRSISINISVNRPIQGHYEYGTESGKYEKKTEIFSCQADKPTTVLINGLKADTLYYYRLRFRENEETAFKSRDEHSFQTSRSFGAPFRFTVQADSHLDMNSSYEVYRKTLSNILSSSIDSKPDFLLDLGDSFMCEKFCADSECVNMRYLRDRAFYGIVSHSVPLFLVNGNHEGENGWKTRKGGGSVSEWATSARQTYYLNPVPDSFYSGSEFSNYYSWEWGNSLFIVLDPYRYSTKKPSQESENWLLTLGKEQYDWLKDRLGKSRAKFRFIFIHQLIGGFGKDGRGGAEAAGFFEWGGKNPDGTPGFHENRPGWDKPIHQLLKQFKVTAVFHGHDHFYARQQVDGIEYILVPQPSHDSGGGRFQAEEYGYEKGTFLPSPGFVSVKVSSDSVQYDYVNTKL